MPPTSALAGGEDSAWAGVCGWLENVPKGPVVAPEPRGIVAMAGIAFPLEDPKPGTWQRSWQCASARHGTTWPDRSRRKLQTDISEANHIRSSRNPSVVCIGLSFHGRSQRMADDSVSQLTGVHVQIDGGSIQPAVTQ